MISRKSFRLLPIFFDSSKLYKGEVLYSRSFSLRSEDFASLLSKDLLSDYRQNKPLKYNTSPLRHILKSELKQENLWKII